MPLCDFRIERPIDVVRWVLFLVVGVLISVLNEALHRARRDAVSVLRDRSELREQLAAIAASMPGLISSFRLRPDGNGSMPYNSPGFRQIYGIDPALVDLSPVLALIHPDDAAAVTASLIESARAMTPRHAQYRVRNPERGQRWLETWATPTREADGSLLWSGYVVDISERKRLEEALRESEERFRRALRGANDGLWDWDLTTGEVFYSPRWKSMLGYREDELGATLDTWRRLLHPDDLAVIRPVLDEYVRGGSAQLEIELRMRHRDGHWVDILSRGLLVRDAAGTPRRLVGTHVDISARKQAEQQLRDRESLLRTTLESTADGILVVDRDGRIAAYNQRFAHLWQLQHDLLERRDDHAAEEGLRRSEEQLRLVTDALPALIAYVDAGCHCRSLNRVCESWFGRPAADIVGRDVRTMIDAALWRQVAPFIERALAGETVTDERELRFCAQAPRWLQMTLTPDRDDAGVVRGFVGLVHDVTERRRAEESQLRSKKLEALGTLSGGIAHDFNNILLAINGNARLAAADLPSDHPAQESPGQISRAGARAADLVRQILAFSRAEEPRRVSLDLGPVVQEAIQLVRSILPPLVEVRSHVGDQLPAVAADPTQVHEIIVNLATNAADAIGAAGGVIDVCLDPVTIDAGYADLALGLAPGPYARLTVSDTGHGMEQTVAERIFDPFFTTKPLGHGTGLGLSVVHGIVASYGGAIAVDSRPGRGTTFRLYFPVGQPNAAVAAPPPAGSPIGRGERVLYDDDDMLVALITRVLTKLGYRVTGYQDPAAALHDVRTHPDAFDVIVTDLSMPGMSGIRLTREILAIRPDVPILMTTGYVRPGDDVAVREAGVLKPDTIDKLGAVLDDTLRAQRAARLDPTAAEG